MAFDYPNITSSDALDTWLNGFKTRIKSIVNAFPGAALNDSSVTVGKLAKPKARGTWSFKTDQTCAAVDNTCLFSRSLLQSDGAAATYSIVGWSVSVNDNEAASATFPTLTKQAGVYLKWYVATGGVLGSLKLTMDISSSSSLAKWVPVSSSAPAITLASTDDVLVCQYVSAAGAVYPGLEVHIDYTLQHAGT